MQSRAVEIDLIILIGQRKYDTDATKTAMEYAIRAWEGSNVQNWAV